MGLSDMEISNIGLGSLAISGRFGGLDDDLSIRAIHEAVDAGINWIHTAPSYGTGYGEMVVGRSLKEFSANDKPYVFTTCTWVFERSDEGDDLAVRTKSLMPESIRKQVEGSLRRLGVECIDLLQFHWPDWNTPIEDSWGYVGDLIKEGKVRSAGLSNHPLELLERAEAIRHVDALQQPLSLIERSMIGPYGNSGGVEVLDYARKHHIGCITFAPLQHGLLTGAYNKQKIEGFTKDGDNLRPKLYWFQEPLLTKILNFVELIRPIAKRHETSVSAIAIAWVLAWDGITGAIVGARKPGQVAGFIDGGYVKLTPEDFDDIEKAIVETGACVGTIGEGPGWPIFMRS
jgi:aryl-alcohol dehydrogenase-like predicted oxidoreductase